MSLASILTAVTAELVANGSLPAGSAALLLGPSSKAPRQQPPQVYWVPKRGQGGPPDVAMSRADQLAANAAGTPIRRTLNTRAIQVECHIWAGGAAAGDDYSATENLLQAVNSALRHSCYGSYEFLGDEYVNRGTDAANLGHKIVAQFIIRVAMIELPASAPGTETVQIETITQTDSMGPIAPGGSTVSSTP